MTLIYYDYERDLDLNLLRVFVLVAECGSVTQAANQLYLTQPAVSAALRRLNDSIGAALFARQGRRLVLTARGSQLLNQTRPHLQALIDASRSPVAFDPRTSQRSVRLGLSDAIEGWLLPELLRRLEVRAPLMRWVVVPVQFRSVSEALLERSVDVAITVADDLPAGIRRETLFVGGFCCLFDPRHVGVKQRISEAAYFAADHVIVSYNADLRGLVEDLLHKQRRVRCSVSSFSNIGAVVDGSRLIATVPEMVARQVRRTRPHLRSAELPFDLSGAPLEMLWPLALDDDAGAHFVRQELRCIAVQFAEKPARRTAPRARRRRAER